MKHLLLLLLAYLVVALQWLIVAAAPTVEERVKRHQRDPPRFHISIVGGTQKTFPIPKELYGFPDRIMVKEALNMLLETTLDDIDKLVTNIEEMAAKGITIVIKNDTTASEGDSSTSTTTTSAGATTTASATKTSTTGGTPPLLFSDRPEPVNPVIETDDNPVMIPSSQTKNDTTSTNANDDVPSMGTPTYVRTEEQRVHELHVLKRFFTEIQGYEMLRKVALWFDDSRDYCDWMGVTCTEQQDGVHVITELEMAGVGLEGTVPVSILDLEHITLLNCSRNRLKGTLPEAFGKSRTLKTIDLGYNFLTSTIPESWADIDSLEDVILSENDLTGTIPLRLYTKSNLRALDVADNALRGSIPTEIGLASNLEFLILGQNLLTGSIPKELGRLSKLVAVDLGVNWLEDNLASTLEFLPTGLSYINLEANVMTGTIPETLFRFSNLTFLSLSHNDLWGTLPLSSDESVSWPPLHILALSRNRLSGPLFPAFLLQMTASLAILDISFNELSGTIPTEIGNLTKLERIDAMSNRFRGTIPTSMQSLDPNLLFNFSDNLLTGAIPSLFCGEGNSSANMLYQEFGCDAVLCPPGTFSKYGHATLYSACRTCPPTEDGEAMDPPRSQILGRTECEGTDFVIGDLSGDGVLSPREILRMFFIDALGLMWGPDFLKWKDVSVNECDLSGVTCTDGEVTKIDLTNAHLCTGENRKAAPASLCSGLPSELGALSSLEVLVLSGKQFLRGSLPTEVGNLSNLQFLDLSSCMLMTGTLPTELGRLTNMKVFKLTHSRVRGPIPTELFGLESLEIIHLTNNRLTSTLPVPSLINTKELMMSRNSVSGTIPTEIGRLTKLENLEAYNNKLSGRLPDALSKCTVLRRFDMFNNNFTGEIPNSFTQLDKLQIVNLKGNQLTSTIPDLGKMQSLTWIDLSNNALHGTIPHSLGSSRIIQELRLGGNMLYEPIPHGLCSNINLNGGMTMTYGCDGVICPLGTYSDSGHATEQEGCTKCPGGLSTLYLGSTKDACQEFSPEMILSMFFEVMDGESWPASFQKNWGDTSVSVCQWGGLSCDENGELASIAFPLVGLEEY